MSAEAVAGDVVTTPKKRGPKKGFKMPENMVPRDAFIRAFMKVHRVDGTRPDVVEELHQLGFDYVTIGTVTSRERYLKDIGVKLPDLRSARGTGGGRACDTESLNALIARMKAGEEG